LKRRREELEKLQEGLARNQEDRLDLQRLAENNQLDAQAFLMIIDELRRLQEEYYTEAQLKDQEELLKKKRKASLHEDENGFNKMINCLNRLNCLNCCSSSI
jgi:enolase